MNPWQKDIETFHRAIGATIGTAPAIRDHDLRAALIAEEAMETVVAIVGAKRAALLLRAIADDIENDALSNTGIDPAGNDLVEAIDGLCDTIVVCLGSAVAFGVDIQPFWAEVQRSNMAKASGPVRADGKRLKPPGWTPPDIAGVLASMTASDE